MKNTLKKQRIRLHEHILWLRQNLIIGSIIFILSLVLFIFALTISKHFTVWLTFGSLCIFDALLFTSYLTSFLQICHLEKCLNSIDNPSYDKIKIECKKARFILERQKFGVLIVGVIFTDATRNKYFYIYPYSLYDNRKFPFKSKQNIKKNIKSSLVYQNIILDCLKNTSIVKSFEAENN